MAPKSSTHNSNITSTNSINVDFKFAEDADRTWADKAKFWEFSNDYEDSQENSSLNTSSEVHFRIIINTKDIETGVLETKHVFPDTTTVYGGTDGVKMLFTRPSYAVCLSLWTQWKGNIVDRIPRLIHQQ